MLAAALPPLPTPAATWASVYNPVLRPREITDVYNGIDINCYNIDALSSCANILTSCNNAAPHATDRREANHCFCDSGLPYLGCFSSVLDGRKCLGYELGDVDWGEYQLSYFEQTCGSVPATAMAQITPPASVALSFETVKVVTVAGSIEKPKQPAQPNYKGSGALLSGDCKKTAFTLVDAGSTAYWAGFNGCQGDKPECCPYTVATPTAAPAVNTPGPDRSGGNALGFNFPQPADRKQAVLKNCADDYYSISGGCCPNGYWLYTTHVGGQTPCYKSMASTATPPALTIGLEDEASDTSKPTSAVANIVWSMRYPVESSSSGLSTGAKAGIGAGAGVAIILIAFLTICLWRSRRKTKHLESADAAQGAQVPPPQYQEQQPAVINGGYPPSHFGASVGMSSSSPLSPQGTGVSATSSQKLPGYSNGAPIPGMPYGSAVIPVAVANGIAYAPPIAEGHDGQPPPQYYPPQQPQAQVYSPPAQSYSPQQLYSPFPSQQQVLPQGQYYFLPQQPQSPQLGYPQQQQQQQQGGYQQPGRGFQPQPQPYHGDMTRNVPMTEMSPQREGSVL